MRKLGLAALVLLILLPWWHASGQPELAELRFFDVGQGDGVLLQAGRWQLLVDTGPDDAIAHQLGESLPWGDSEIETVVVTHQHADHYRGLQAVLAHYKVGRLLIAPGSGDPEYADLLRQADAKGVRAEQLAAPLQLPTPTGISVRVRPPESVSADPNDRSLVTFVQAGRSRVLLTGDAEQAEERELLRSGESLTADILKAGHHGSRTSSTSPFVAAVHPKVTVISCGRRNRYGHPAATTLATYKRAGSLLYRTDQNGTVKIRFTADGYRVSSER